MSSKGNFLFGYMRDKWFNWRNNYTFVVEHVLSEKMYKFNHCLIVHKIFFYIRALVEVELNKAFS